MKLVHFQRLIAFVPRPRIAEILPSHVLHTDAAGDLPKALGGSSGEVIENNIVVFQPFGFLNREEQGGLEMGAGRRFILRVHHDDSKMRGLAGFLD